LWVEEPIAAQLNEKGLYRRAGQIGPIRHRCVSVCYLINYNNCSVVQKRRTCSNCGSSGQPLRSPPATVGFFVYGPHFSNQPVETVEPAKGFCEEPFLSRGLRLRTALTINGRKRASQEYPLENCAERSACFSGTWVCKCRIGVISTATGARETGSHTLPPERPISS